MEVVKAFFKQLKQISNRKLFIIPWYDMDKDFKNIVTLSQFPVDKSD